MSYRVPKTLHVYQQDGRGDTLPCGVECPGKWWVAESELSNDKQANDCTLLCDFCGYVNLLMMLTVTAACMNFVVLV